MPAVNRTRARKKEDGFSLQEVLIASAVLFVILAVLVSVYLMALRYMRHALHTTEELLTLRKAQDQIVTELLNANPSTFVIDHGDSNFDRIAFQLPVSRQGEQITWGAGGRQDWWVEYRVVGGVLRRRLLDAAGQWSQADGEVLFIRNMDTLWYSPGRKGFSVTRTGDLLALSLRSKTGSVQTGDIRNELSTEVLLGP